jgi:hypothetical protein
LSPDYLNKHLSQTDNEDISSNLIHGSPIPNPNFQSACPTKTVHRTSYSLHRLSKPHRDATEHGIDHYQQTFAQRYRQYTRTSPNDSGLSPENKVIHIIHRHMVIKPRIMIRSTRDNVKKKAVKPTRKLLRLQVGSGSKMHSVAEVLPLYSPDVSAVSMI